MRRLLVLSCGLLIAVAACGPTVQPFALVASAPGGLQVGEQRILLGLVDPETQEFLPDPEVAASATFTGPDATTIDVPLEFIWAVPDERGLYRAQVEFEQAGSWSVSVSAEGYDSTEPTPFPVAEDTAMPQVGEVAPAVATRTAADHDLAAITSDPDPDPDFYRLSLDEALADDRPTVIVFATPAFCTSQTCGPMLEDVKEMAGDHPGVDFLHVEVYENLDATSFEELEPVEAVEEWALPSEPWVFVTDSEGVITARFEGAMDARELAEALGSVGT
jgi:hypothetical protein